MAKNNIEVKKNEANHKYVIECKRRIAILQRQFKNGKALVQTLNMFSRYVQRGGSKEEDINDIVVCEHCIENNIGHCEVKLGNSSPTNAINRLRVHHRIIYEQLMKDTMN